MEEEPRVVDEVELLRYGGYAEEDDVDVPRAVLVARWSASLECIAGVHRWSVRRVRRCGVPSLFGGRSFFVGWIVM
jgi:hypothetical protein